MCTSPFSIFNNSKFINPHYMDVFRTVRCGKCLSCQHSLQIEYALRSYFEYRHAQDDGGFTYWDTLTFDDDHLPLFHGFPCFDKSSISLYIKRLRKYIADNFKLYSDVFRFLCISEYGEKKHRPHYHIVFFVHDPNLTPEQLQTAINSCWQFGLTANGYRLATAISRHCDFIVKNNAALTYVAKYLYKDDFWSSKYIDDVEYELTQKGIEFDSKDIKRKFKPFRLSSINFGSYLLELGEYDYEEETTSMPVALNVNKTFTLPIYYRRKLYYHLVKFEDGKLSWQPNSDYADKLLRLENYKYEKEVFDITNHFRSVDSIYRLDPSITAFIDAKFNLDGLQPSKYLDLLMNGRDIRLLTLYKRYFRNRYCATVEQIEDVINHRFEKIQYFSNNPLYSDDLQFRKDSREWYKENLIHENTYPDFYNFDKVLNFLDSIFKQYTRISLLSDRNDRLARKKVKDVSIFNPLF